MQTAIQKADDIGLTNGYIFSMLKRHIKLSETFMDVYSADTVDVRKLRRRKNFIFVCNLANSNQEGTHFVCVAATPGKQLYLDSFGLRLEQSSPVLYTKLRKIGRPIIRKFKRPIQHPLSAFCGMYAIFFACKHDKARMSDTSGLKLFKRHGDLHENDAICMRNIKVLLHNNPRA